MVKKFVAVFYLLFIGINLVGHAQETQPSAAKLLEFYQTQRYREAAAYIEHFYPDTITNTAVLSRLGYCYHMAGEYAKAEQYYLKLFAIDSLNVATLLNLAAVHVQRGTYPSAIDYYQRVVDADTSHVPSFKALSGLMQRQGNDTMAYRYLERANSLQPANADIGYDFARMCMNAEQYGKADTVLDRALQADPGHNMLLFGKMQVAEKLRRYQDMVTFGERLVDIGDESLPALSTLARGYFHTNDFIRCKTTYGKLETRQEKLGEMDYYYLAMAHKATKHYGEGLTYMDKVLELAISPNTAFYYGRKAELHDLANQPSAAASTYLRSFQFEVIPIHYYSLAVVHDRKLNNPHTALKYYRLYLKQNPPKAEYTFVEYVQKRINELQ